VYNWVQSGRWWKVVGKINSRGEFKHNMDAKFRVVLPTKFRDELGEKFVFTRGLDKCLFAYSSEAFEALEEKAKAWSFTDKDVRKFVRFFFGGACDCEFDAQGRVVVPPHLREYANLNKEVLSMKVPGRIELWGNENWAGYNGDDDDIDDEIAEKMAELGI